MSKRRKSTQPNIPEETLRRARQEAGLEPPDPIDDVEAEAEAIEVEAVAPPPAPARKPAPAPRAASARREPAYAAEAAAPRKRKRRPDKVSYEEMTHEEVMHLLDHPTKTVSEAQLRAQYSYVLTDLRSMFILAAVLFVVMIVAATIFV
jgi:hypothetical protein